MNAINPTNHLPSSDRIAKIAQKADELAAFLQSPTPTTGASLSKFHRRCHDIHRLLSGVRLQGAYTDGELDVMTNLQTLQVTVPDVMADVPAGAEINISEVDVQAIGYAANELRQYLNGRSPAGAEVEKSAVKTNGTGKRNPTVNARMIDTLGKKPESAGWTCKQWADHLQCSQSAIVGTNVWKSMKLDREKGKAERASEKARQKRRK